MSADTRPGTHERAKRGKVTGWSASAARRNTAFLRSVDERHLGGYGLAITLTVRDCPPTPAEWSAAVKSWLMRQSRAGMIRCHWVMEFQRRGVPHLHAAVWYDFDPEQVAEDDLAGQVRAVEAFHKPTMDWIDIAAKWGASERGQHTRQIDGVVGWFEYMAKHCSRSKLHYQRQRDAVPSAWSTTGRVWGHRGDWETVEPIDINADRDTFWRLRRLVKKSRLAEARASLPLNRKQVAHLRRILKTPDRKLSEVRAVSEWMSIEKQEQLLVAAMATG